jgi:hypothetical protein
MFQEYVFRFLTVRPGTLVSKTVRAPQKVLVYEPERRTELRAALERLHAAGASRAEVLRVVAAYQASDKHVGNVDNLGFDVAKGLAWLAAHGADNTADMNLKHAITQVYGASPEDIVGSAEYLETLDRVSDTLVAESFRTSWATPTDKLAGARKLLWLVRTIADGVGLQPGTRLGAALDNLTLIIPDYAGVPGKPPAPPAPPSGPTPEDTERNRLRKHLQDLEEAHRELSRKVTDEGAVEVSKARVETAPAEAPAERSARAAEPGGEVTATASVGRLVFKANVIKSLSDATRRVLAKSNLDPAGVDPIGAVARIEDEMHATAARLAASESPNTVLLLGGVMLNARKLTQSLKGMAFGAPVPENCHFQAGVADLLLVKQTLKAYELAEFAHVENVLAGESREREHRRLNVREEIVATEEERETEKERNLESTERNEMQSEAEKTVKSQFQLESGLQISGSYGPSASFSASLNTGFSTSAEETQRKAVSYSREVTDKTSERVRERVKQETRRRMLEQIEEINRHSITNVPATHGHIRGIYRWLNKVYDAQIFNYGQRMMFEFVVPEPAAYLLYALIENPPADTELVKPLPPTYFGAPLKPAHLTRTGYLDYVATYQVRNVPAPPPQFQHVATFDKQDRLEDPSSFGRAGKIDIPAGYEAFGAAVMTDYSFETNVPHRFRVMIGERLYDRTNSPGSQYQILNMRYHELGFAFHLHLCKSFAIAIDVACQLTTEGFAKWQQQAYDAIMEAYLQQKADYEEKLAALGIQQGVKILGRNPLENRRIEREELKKLVLMMLTGDNDIARNSMLPSTEPLIDLAQACSNGSWIRFFENAFEWNNMLYVLYPYFWGRQARWISALHFTDPDLDFAAFLKAGAARVQVPVRPGFEKAIAHFCQFTEIWEGNDPPLTDDDLYVPIVDEIAENLGKLDEGVPYPPDSQPWEVRIPTSLVLVQNLDEVPGIRDVLTGNAIVITG